MGRDCNSERMATRQLFLRSNKPYAKAVGPTFDDQVPMAPDERLPVVSVSRFIHLAEQLRAQHELIPIALSLCDSNGHELEEDDVAPLIRVLQETVSRHADLEAFQDLLDAYLILAASFQSGDGRRVTLSRRGRIEAASPHVDDFADWIVTAWAS